MLHVFPLMLNLFELAKPGGGGGGGGVRAGSGRGRVLGLK